MPYKILTQQTKEIIMKMKKERDFMTMQNIILKHDLYSWNKDKPVKATHYKGEGQSYATIDVKKNVVCISHEASHRWDITHSNYLSCDDIIKIANLIKKQRREAK